MYNKWVNRNKTYKNSKSDESDVQDEEEEEDDESENLSSLNFPQNIDLNASEIEAFEIDRKNLANKTAFPISTNLEAWNALRKYRFYMIKNDKTINIWESWPLHIHTVKLLVW